jgi:hypothetical protein
LERSALKSTIFMYSLKRRCTPAHHSEVGDTQLEGGCPLAL